MYNGDNIISEYLSYGVQVGGTGSLVPLTLKKNYLNSIGTDSVLAYDAEQQVNPTSTGKVTNRYYYHTNQLGSVIAISTSTGQVIQKYTYNAYGKPYIYSGSTLTPLSSYTGTLYGNTRLYTGREYDRETGYYYLRARTYSPDLGRFLSRDPIGQNDQVNLYTYVRNSPLNYTDRNGKKAKTTIATLTIYTQTNNLIGHSWIEITEGDNVTTYGLWPDRGGASEPGWNLPQIYDGIQVNGPETSYTKDSYSSFASMSMQMNQEQLNKVNSFIATQIEEGRKWHEWSPCSAFASDVWNSVATNKLEDRNGFGFLISTPATLRDSILIQVVKDFPIKFFLFSNLD